MAMKLFALRGVGNCGKTQTIRHVYKLLCERHPHAITSHLIDRGKDFRVVLTVSGAKIGIESQGDPCSRLQDSLTLFRKLECRVIVCATRSRGATVEAVAHLAPSYEIHWLHQVVVAGPELVRSDANAAMAQRIVDSVTQAIQA